MLSFKLPTNTLAPLRLAQNLRTSIIGFIGLVILVLSACITTEVRTTAFTPLTVEDTTIAENRLLDVGIVQFNTGLDLSDDDPKEENLVFPELRQAESRYLAVTLAESLQSSQGWGAVRVIPENRSSVDIIVTGTIVQSDGETLSLNISVSDSRGQQWFSKEYSEHASHYAYDRKSPTKGDAFQGVYHQIANDMLAYRQKLSDQYLSELRTISEIKFAKEFSPNAFERYINKTDSGLYQLVGLPAENDPMIVRIRRIRERDYLFVDTLQDYYGTFVKSMELPYQEWRALSYKEVRQMRELKRKARNNTIMGVASIVGGIAAAGSGGGAARQAGNVAVVGGGYLVKTGFDRRAEAKMHIEALQELGDSMEAEVEPRIIELEDRTVTLSGSVDNQYKQWRELLFEIYKEETGELESI